jgi:peroxiredoxin Q/BCP
VPPLDAGASERHAVAGSPNEDLSMSLALGALLVCLAGELPKVGELAPDFTLADQHGAAASLSSFHGKENVLVAFYGKDADADGAIELKALRDAGSSFKAASTTVLAIAADDQASHEKLAASLGLTFPLLTDERLETAERYGVVTGSGDARTVQRAMFLVDAEGRLAFIDTAYRVNASLAGSPLLKELEKLASRPRRVTFESAPGVEIAAMLYPVAGATKPTALMFPGMRFDRKVWDAFALQLQAAGVPALAVDLRGQGESNRVEGKEVRAPDALAKDPAFATGMLADARGAAKWLAEHKLADHGILFVGSSLGANIALLAAAEEAHVRGALVLSPGLDYSGLHPLPAVKKLGETPIMIVCGQEPVRADAEQLRAAGAKAELLARDQAAHGTALFERDPELSGLLLAWVKKVVGE